MESQTGKISLKEQELLDLLRYRRENNPRFYREMVRIIRSSTESNDIQRHIGGLKKL